MATLISDKVDVRTKKITKDREEYYIIIKDSIHHEDIAILTPNNRPVKYIKKKMKGERGYTVLKIWLFGNWKKFWTVSAIPLVKMAASWQENSHY